MNWTQNEYKGFRNAANTAYVGQLHCRRFGLWQRTGSGWRDTGRTFGTAAEAMAAGEALVPLVEVPTTEVVLTVRGDAAAITKILEGFGVVVHSAEPVAA